MPHLLFWRFFTVIIHTSVTDICFCQIVYLRKKVTLNPGLRSGICISILVLPCTKSERIKQAEELLLCYSSSKPQTIYSTGGLWEGVVINLSRSIHWKAKSLHILQQKKYSTVRGHHCCMQNSVKSICSSWRNLPVCCGMYGAGVHSVVSVLLRVSLWQNFQQSPLEGYLGWQSWG